MSSHCNVKNLLGLFEIRGRGGIGSLRRAGRRVSGSAGSAAKGAERKAGLAKINEVYDALRAKNWAEEKQEFGYGWCSVLTPPASEKDAPIMSGCLAEAKGKAIGVTYLDPKQKLAPRKAKALLDKAIGQM